jgi:hypothetical protein
MKLSCPLVLVQAHVRDAMADRQGWGCEQWARARAEIQHMRPEGTAHLALSQEKRENNSSKEEG